MRTWRFYSVVCAAAVIGLPACAVRTTLPEAAAVMPLFAGAVADVARMARETNEARFDALTAMLAERRIPFDVEPFTIEPRTGEPRTQGRNIVVTIAGRSPEIVVGAHYDAARLADGALSKGAVDNAASSVILVRVAEALLKARPRTRIRVVFFDMEELGLLGSARFVQSHRDRPTRAMVNLDVNGFGDAVMIGPRTDSNEAVFLALRAGCAAIATLCVEFPTMPPSDDRSFHDGGIPAVSIATVPALQAHQLWLRVNGGQPSGLRPGFTPEILETIHTGADTPDLVEPDTMARAYRLVLALVGGLDGR